MYRITKFVFLVFLTFNSTLTKTVLSQNWNCGTEISDSSQSKSLSCTNNSIAYTDIY